MPRKKSTVDIHNASLPELITMKDEMEKHLKDIEKAIAYNRSRVFILIENASIYYQQFASDDPYGRKGSNFCVYIEDEDNIKELVSIGINFLPDNHTFIVRIPPLNGIPSGKVAVMRRGSKDFDLDAETIGVLNHADIKYAELVIRPYYCERGDAEPFVIAYLYQGRFVVNDEKKDEKKFEKLKKEAEQYGYSIIPNSKEKITICSWEKFYHEED